MSDTFDNSSLSPRDTPGKKRNLLMEEDKLKNELSDREKEVIEELRKGKSYAEVGKALCISAQTVKRHAANIYAKLDVRNKIEAVNKFFDGK